jgi:ribosome-associated protein
MDTYEKRKEAALALGKLIADHKGENVAVLDLREKNSWADFFVIATVTSSTHSHGLYKHVMESSKELGLELHPTKKRIPDGDEWALIDLGDVIVHLMTPAARSFYDLEKLWYGSPDLMKP